MMAINDLIEHVARGIWDSNFHPDDVASGEAERRISDWPEDWAKAKRQALAALRAAARPIMDYAATACEAVLVSESHPDTGWHARHPTLLELAAYIRADVRRLEDVLK